MKSLILFSLLLIVTNCWAGADPAKIGEPTVSSEEAEILSKAFDLLKESPEQAIKFIGAQITLKSSPALDFTLGNFYLQTGAWGLAEAAYRKALEKMPEFTAARANLGRVLIKQDKIDAAIEVFRPLLIKGTADPETLTLIGHTFLLRGQPVPAETAFRQAILLNPDDINAYLGLTKSLLTQGRLQESVKLLKNLLEINPQNAQLWFVLANTYLSLEKPDQALVSLETARRLGIIHSEALATLGELYLNRGQVEEALIVYQKAFAGEDPSVSRLLRAIEGFVFRERIKEAEIMFKRLDDLKQEQADILSFDERHTFYRLRAHQFRLKGDHEEALKLYQKLLEKDPLDGRVLMAAGDIHRKKGRFEEALISYERAGRIPDKSHQSLILQAQIEIERENFSRAAELLEAAQALKPDPRIARYLEQIRRLIR